MSKLLFSGAEGGSRTRTGFKPHWILSPARLPIPPLRLICYKVYDTIKSKNNQAFIFGLFTAFYI